MYAAVLMEINSTCECFSKRDNIGGVWGLFWSVREEGISWGV